MNPILFQILTAHPDKFPKALHKRYPRVLDRISSAWATPEADGVFAELMVADHQNRQGFPPDVMSEILSLHSLHEKYLREAPPEVDPWALEPDMSAEESALFVQELERNGGSFTPGGLFKAVEEGATELAFNFVRAGMAVDVRRADEWTPLMVALFNGHEETAMMLLSRGANVRARTSRGYEPIHWAALNGYTRAVRFILDKGGNPNAQTDYGWTPLLQAASRGHAEIVRILIQKGAVVNHAEHEGWTALHKACANGHVEVVRLLVQHGADTRLRAASGVTPLELAMKTKDFELLKALSTEPVQAASSTSPF